MHTARTSDTTARQMAKHQLTTAADVEHVRNKLAAAEARRARRNAKRAREAAKVGG
jgi:hypothetical protein